MARAWSRSYTTVADIYPAVPIIRNTPYFPLFRALKVRQDLYHQQSFYVVVGETMGSRWIGHLDGCSHATLESIY